jgi:hypothetical protein
MAIYIMVLLKVMMTENKMTPIKFKLLMIYPSWMINLRCNNKLLQIKEMSKKMMVKVKVMMTEKRMKEIGILSLPLIMQRTKDKLRMIMTALLTLLEMTVTMMELMISTITAIKSSLS